MHLVGVELDLGSDIASNFAHKIGTINLVAVAKFFHIIYKRVLLSLFASGYYNGDLLRLVLIYFRQ